MTRTIIAALAFAFATPALADDAPPARQFTRDGMTYSYTTRIVGDATIIEGRNVTTGELFALTVRRGQVVGTYNESAVSFFTSKFDAGAIAAR